MADIQLAATLGTEYARMILGVLPRVEEAIKRGKKTVSFTVTAKFRVGKDGEVETYLKQSTSIPMDSASFKLIYHAGQLALFEGQPK